MGQQKQKYNMNNVFYGVIGVATLMLATIGATFAYYTATASNNTAIKGNMATIKFDLSVTKVTDADESKGGMIPMSNNMMEQALKSSKGVCLDNNGNAVCQVYKVTVANTSTASMFLDGYVSLSGGSGAPVDWTTYTQNAAKTSMRWAQVFCNTETLGKVDNTCTTGGNSTVRPDSTPITMPTLGVSDTAKADGKNLAEIKDKESDVTQLAKINGNDYEVIKQNYIRVSDHAVGSTAYNRTKDITSALVYSQYLEANDDNGANNTGTSATTYKDAQVYYFVVWLSENGHNQTAGAAGAAPSATDFYQGNVTFISAQGSEVTATFSGHTRVPATDNQA